MTGIDWATATMASFGCTMDLAGQRRRSLDGGSQLGLADSGTTRLYQHGYPVQDRMMAFGTDSPTWDAYGQLRGGNPTDTEYAVTLDLQSQRGGVYWFDHERGEFLPLEDHLGSFLKKCTFRE